MSTTSIHVGARPTNLARRCILNRTGNYTEVLQLQPVEALPGFVELQVLSVLRDARDPQEEQVRYRTVLPPDGLQSLLALLEGWPGLRRHGEG